MVGQLQDAGNTVTVAGYLDLLGKAGLVTAIPKFSDKELAKRRSTPRLMVYDTAFMTALGDKGRAEWLEDSARRGHLVESAVGARLLARAPEEGFEVMWWREGVKEVDFVLRRDDALSAIEVKSGGESGQSGMSTLLKSIREPSGSSWEGRRPGRVPWRIFCSIRCRYLTSLSKLRKYSV